MKTTFLTRGLLLVFLMSTIVFFSFTNQNSKKMNTYVLVHGAFAGKYAWDKVTPLLEKAGNKVVTLDLPGHGDDNTPAAQSTMDSYVAAVTNLVNQQEGKVILVGHSMGGMVISQVAENIPQKISKLVYLSAYLPKNGESLLNLSEKGDAESKIGPNLQLAADYSTATLKEEAVIPAFCADCDEATQQFILSKQKAEPLSPFQATVTLTDKNFGSVAKYYIETLKDYGVGNKLQKAMVAGNGTVKKVYSLNCGHSPYFAKPKELSEILNKL